MLADDKAFKEEVTLDNTGWRKRKNLNILSGRKAKAKYL
jgi:hypothetical protein